MCFDMCLEGPSFISLISSSSHAPGPSHPSSQLRHWHRTRMPGGQQPERDNNRTRPMILVLGGTAPSRLSSRRHGTVCQPECVCVYYCRTYDKAVRGPGGGRRPGRVEDKCYHDERRRTFHTKISETENLVTSFKYSVFFVFLTHLCNVVNVYCNTKLFAGGSY